MPVKISKVRRLVNPTRKTASARRPKRKAQQKRRKTSRNPAPAIVTLGYANPTGGPMKKKKTRRSPAKPVRRRRNPSRRVTARASDMVKVGAFALGGLVLTRQIPQAVLGQKNTGVIGYLSNAVTAVGAAAAVTKIGGKQAGQAVLIGGALYTVERVLNEQFTPLGRALSLSGMGDAAAHGGMGAIHRAYFPWPVVHDKQGNPVIPPEIIAEVKRAIPAPAATAAASLSGTGRFQGRF